MTEAACSKPTQGPTKLSEPRTLMSSTPWTSWRMNRSLRSCQCQQISPHRVARAFQKYGKREYASCWSVQPLSIIFSFRNLMLDLNRYIHTYGIYIYHFTHVHSCVCVGPRMYIFLSFHIFCGFAWIPIVGNRDVILRVPTQVNLEHACRYEGRLVMVG